MRLFDAKLDATKPAAFDVPMRSLRLVSKAFFASFCLATLMPTVALANGRFPIADHLVEDPKDPSHIVLRTTYGILETSDAGKSWSWICEFAVGYGGTQDPAIGVQSDGTILAGIFEGLAVSHDRGCSWGFVGAPLASEYVIDVAVHKDDPSRAVAITSTGTGGGFHVIVAETADNGQTWSQAGSAIMNDFIALTIDVAPSDPNRLYASGIVGKTFVPAIHRSDDRGVTWTRFYLDAAWAEDVPFITAIDPTNPDRVYLRLSGGMEDHLLVSDDGALTFTDKYATMDDLLGAALSPDGSRIAIGGPKDGVLVASTADLVFQQQSALYTRCLTWTNVGLYACANQFEDAFTVGLSTDEGKTFKGIYNLPDICPITCPSGATTPAACTSTWPVLAATLGTDVCACGNPSDCSSTSSSSSSGGVPEPLEGGGGCNCSVHPQAPGWGALGLAFLTSMGALLRHRPRRFAPLRRRNRRR